MRVLGVSNLYPPNALGGYEKLCELVMRALAGQGHEVALVTCASGATPENEQVGGVAVHRALTLQVGASIYEPFDGSPELLKQISLENSERLQVLAEQFQPDVVFAWNMYGFHQGLLEGLESLGLPLVYLLTDNWMINALSPDFLADYMRSVLDEDYSLEAMEVSPIFGNESFIRRSPKLVRGCAIFPSEFMRRLHEASGLEFASSRVVPHGTAATQGRRSRTIQQRLTGGDEVRLLFAGRLVHVKGVHVLLEALDHLVEMLPDKQVHLTLLGGVHDSGYVSRLENLVRAAGHHLRVSFMPEVSNDELRDVFMAHDIYVFPSLYEPFSLTLIDALKSGIPTVASRIGGNTELVVHEKSGLLYEAYNPRELAECVARLVREAEFRRKLSKKATKVGAKFTLERMVARISEALETARSEQLSR